MVKIVPSLVATLCLSCSALAFVPQNAQVRDTSVEMATTEKKAVIGFARFFGVLTTAAVVSFHPVDATATTNYDSVSKLLQFEYMESLFDTALICCFVLVFLAPFASSTVQVADATKTLDMSLPTYDDVKSYKASTENVPGLTVTAGKGGTGIPVSQAKRGGMPASSVLPSMGKKSAKEKKAERVKTVDMPMKYDF